MGFLGIIDWLVIGLYFLVIAGIAVWSMRNKKDSAQEYFLAGRNIGWFVVGTSILSSNIGSEKVVGLSGTAVQSGVIMGHCELPSWIVLLLGWVFVPFYMRALGFTLLGLVRKRVVEGKRVIIVIKHWG